MMKSIIFILFLLLFASGCGLIDSNSNSNSKQTLNASFTLTDTTGNLSKTFHSGKPFNMSFSLINTSGRPITFIYPGSPPIHFQILQNDILVSESVYSGPNISGNFTDTLKARDTLQYTWEAPNAWGPAQNPLTILAPGSYQAKVFYPNFNEVNVNCTSLIGFSVVQ